LAENRIAMSDVTEADSAKKPHGKPGLSLVNAMVASQKVQTLDDFFWIEKAALKQEMQQWRFPLHFIDFETTRVAIPFNRGRHPYSWWRFNSHIISGHQTGALNIRAVSQYERGVFPNYDFVSAL